MSAAAMIMAGGATGKRFALPNAKLMIHQGSAGFRGAPSDIQIAAREVAATTRQMAEIIGRHAGRDIEVVLDDIDRHVNREHLEATLMSEGLKKFSDPQKALLKLVAEKRAKLPAN